MNSRISVLLVLFSGFCAVAYFIIYYILYFSLSLKSGPVQIAESPAEFFSENKNIAGFDNVSFV